MQHPRGGVTRLAGILYAGVISLRSQHAFELCRLSLSARYTFSSDVAGP